ncbi:MAG: hypothetical protein ACO3P3_05830, partial [Candidatus Nanopelagicales bacterium]
MKKLSILVAFALILVSIAMPVLADESPTPDPTPSESTSTPFLPLKSLNTFKKRLASSSLTKSTS